jgi:hypothetical protein
MASQFYFLRPLSHARLPTPGRLHHQLPAKRFRSLLGARFWTQVMQQLNTVYRAVPTAYFGRGMYPWHQWILLLINPLPHDEHFCVF